MKTFLDRILHWVKVFFGWLTSRSGSRPEPGDFSHELRVIYAQIGDEKFALVGAQPLRPGGSLVLGYEGDLPELQFESYNPLEPGLPIGGHGSKQKEIGFKVKEDARPGRYFFRVTIAKQEPLEVLYQHFLEVKKEGIEAVRFRLSRQETHYKLTLKVFLQPKTWIKVAYENLNLSGHSPAENIYVYYIAKQEHEDSNQLRFPDYIKVGPREDLTLPLRFDGPSMQVRTSLVPPKEPLAEVVGGDDADLEIPPPGFAGPH